MNQIIERNIIGQILVCFPRAAEEEIGAFSLRMIAQESGLKPDRINLLMGPEPVLMTAAEFAALFAALPSLLRYGFTRQPGADWSQRLALPAQPGDTRREIGAIYGRASCRGRCVACAPSRHWLTG